mmetsp:Transcript_29855/g.72143  ORF Transcript_29855/g.72143 Transcript_29855/m.72143 type:complete len:85 (-) Transcript_29855:129-383(-)
MRETDGIVAMESTTCRARRRHAGGETMAAKDNDPQDAAWIGSNDTSSWTDASDDDRMEPFHKAKRPPPYCDGAAADASQDAAHD